MHGPRSRNTTQLIDAWTVRTGVAHGHVFRSRDDNGRLYDTEEPPRRAIIVGLWDTSLGSSGLAMRQIHQRDGRWVIRAAAIPASAQSPMKVRALEKRHLSSQPHQRCIHLAGRLAPRAPRAANHSDQSIQLKDSVTDAFASVWLSEL